MVEHERVPKEWLGELDIALAFQGTCWGAGVRQCQLLRASDLSTDTQEQHVVYW